MIEPWLSDSKVGGLVNHHTDTKPGCDPALLCVTMGSFQLTVDTLAGLTDEEEVAGRREEEKGRWKERIL